MASSWRWASNSKYAFYGALRSAAQMVSYEVSIGFVIVTVLLTVGSLNLTQVVESQAGDGFWSWHFFGILFPMFIVFIISALARRTCAVRFAGREAELVSGYNVEYSSMTFAMFFLGEYANMMSGMTAVLFLGGWLLPIDITIQLDTRANLVRVEDRGLSVHFPLGPRDVSSLSL